MMPLLKYTAIEIKTVAIGKEIRERDTGYYTRASSAPSATALRTKSIL
jgi:hypothetical protein